MAGAFIQPGRRFTRRFLIVRGDQVPHFVLVQCRRGGGDDDEHQRQGENSCLQDEHWKRDRGCKPALLHHAAIFAFVSGALRRTISTSELLDYCADQRAC